MEYSQSRSIAVLLDAIRFGDSILIEELWDVPKALVASLAAKEANRPVLLLTGGMREDSLFDNLEQLAPGFSVEFPAWETLPGEEILPSPDIIGKRMEALHALSHAKTPRIVLCPIASFLQKIPSKDQLSPQLVLWKKGDEIPFEKIPQILSDLGYKQTAVVSDKGEFAVRGGIIDLFPTASSDPFRIDFFENEIESIRTFDPVGQKSIQKVDSLFLCPANEMALLAQAKRLVSILDYLGENPLILWDDLAAIEDAYVALKQMPGAKSPFLYQLDDLFKRLEGAQHLFCTKEKIEEISAVQLSASLRSKLLQPIRFESLGRQFDATRFFHPFRKIHDYFEPPEKEEAGFLDYFRPVGNQDTATHSSR